MNHDFPIFHSHPLKNFKLWPDWRDVIPRARISNTRWKQYTPTLTIEYGIYRMAEWKLRVGRDTRGRIARHPNPGIIPETFEFFGSRLLVKIGHYNAICVTDQRAWNVSTGTVLHRQGKQEGKIPSGIQEAKLLVSRKWDINIYQGLSGIETYNFLCIDLVSLLPTFLLYCYFFNFNNGYYSVKRIFNVAGLIDNYYRVKRIWRVFQNEKMKYYWLIWYRRRYVSNIGWLYLNKKVYFKNPRMDS